MVYWSLARRSSHSAGGFTARINKVKLLGQVSSQMAATMSGVSVVRWPRQKVRASSATAKAKD